MPVDARWISQAGRKTDDNRDYCGVGFRTDDALCIVLDGSSTGDGSGALVREIARELIDWFVDARDPVTEQVLIDRLRTLHGPVSSRFPRASASYMAVYVTASHGALILHAGDCLLGRRQPNGSLTWLSQPHTLANAGSAMSITTLAAIPARHRLTRSFRGREFMPPDILTTGVGEGLAIVTDGFWAELDEGEQARFMDGGDVAMPEDGDDRSVLVIGQQSGKDRCAGEPSANLYVKATARQ